MYVYIYIYIHIISLSLYIYIYIYHIIYCMLLYCGYIVALAANASQADTEKVK